MMLSVSKKDYGIKPGLQVVMRYGIIGDIVGVAAGCILWFVPGFASWISLGFDSLVGWMAIGGSMGTLLGGLAGLIVRTR